MSKCIEYQREKHQLLRSLPRQIFDADQFSQARKFFQSIKPLPDLSQTIILGKIQLRSGYGLGIWGQLYLFQENFPGRQMDVGAKLSQV